MTMSTKPAESPRDWPIMALSEMRAKGWTVAVHNDYRLNGQPMTFWLFTHEASERFVKGEGPTDWAAVKQALAAARRLLDAPPGVGERMREAMAAALTELENYLGDCADYEAPEGMDHLRAETIEQVREALAAPAPAEPERAKHIPGTIPLPPPHPPRRAVSRRGRVASERRSWTTRARGAGGQRAHGRAHAGNLRAQAVADAP
jgi:hypothetical protein